MKEREIKKQFVWAVWGLVGLLGAFVCLKLFTPQPSIVTKASPLVTAEGWIQNYGGYFWEDEKNILAFRSVQSGLQAISVDIETGKETSLAGLTKAFANAKTGDVANWRLSSDGKRLLWRSRSINRQESLWSISDLDGKALKSWRCRTSLSSPLWMPDTESWLEMKPSSGSDPIIHSIASKDTVLTTINSQPSFAFSVSPDRKLISMNQPDRRGNFSWNEYSLTTAPVFVTTRDLRLPKGCDGIQEAEMSPDGKQVAILFTAVQTSTLENLVRRLLPNSGFANQTHLQLWVFSRDGNQRHLIGAETGAAISGVLWTLDSRQVSFMTHGKLFRISPEG